MDSDQTATIATAERFALGTSPVFTPDSKYLKSGSQDTSVVLWDLSKVPMEKAPVDK